VNYSDKEGGNVGGLKSNILRDTVLASVLQTDGGGKRGRRRTAR
jgi:hypothetical protein